MARKSDNEIGCSPKIIFLIVVIAVFFGTVLGMEAFLSSNRNFVNENIVTLFFTLIACILIVSFYLYSKQQKDLNNIIDSLEVKIKELTYQKDVIENEKIQSLEKNIKELSTQKSILERTQLTLKSILIQKDKLFESYKNSDILNISTLYADFLTLEYSLSEEWLNNKEVIVKHNPEYYSRIRTGRVAKKSAEIVSELRKDTKSYIEQYKVMLYKYEALLSLFPELKIYVDDIESIKELTRYKNIDSIKEEYDRVIDFVSKEDYKNKSVDDRNQLALTKYINGRKSNWQIGRDYEMYCAYNYEKNGWVVERFGIEKRLNDMGRDLIAIKDDTIHIIQCKLWSKDKMIHEKHIAQLYGSTIEYMISAESSLFEQKIIPVFITNIELSETAKKFANRLKVLVCKWPMQEYPRIKCNINNGQRIYHLPFDQQYDRTQIKNEGESYEYTVKEAVAKGFIRAKRHFFSD